MDNLMCNGLAWTNQEPVASLGGQSHLWAPVPLCIACNAHPKQLKNRVLWCPPPVSGTDQFLRTLSAKRHLKNIVFPGFIMCELKLYDHRSLCNQTCHTSLGIQYMCIFQQSMISNYNIKVCPRLYGRGKMESGFSHLLFPTVPAKHTFILLGHQWKMFPL